MRVRTVAVALLCRNVNFSGNSKWSQGIVHWHELSQRQTIGAPEPAAYHAPYGPFEDPLFEEKVQPGTLRAEAQVLRNLSAYATFSRNPASRCPYGQTSARPYHVSRAVYCITRAPCAEFRRLISPSVLGVPMPGWFSTLKASRFRRSFTLSVISTL